MFSHRIAALLVLFTALALGACSTTPATPVAHDPWEGFNRSMHDFNTSVDGLVLKPVAETYRESTPQFVQTGVGNFLSNLGDLLVISNDLLQLKLDQAGQDTSRFFLNSVVGIFGLFDVATPLGLVKHEEDFGQTLGYWGVDSGPYLVLPFLGPSTVRDTGGLVGDSFLNPVPGHLNNDEQLALTLVRTIDSRAKLLAVEGVLNTAALDRYSYIRDAWLARREHKVNDGEPGATSAESNETDELDELDELDALDEPGNTTN